MTATATTTTPYRDYCARPTESQYDSVGGSHRTTRYRSYCAQTTESPGWSLPPGRVVVNRTASPMELENWQKDALRFIAELGQLEVNWDGYGSQPPAEAAREWASKLVMRTNLGILPPPGFSPESSGAIQIDWKSGHNRELEFHVDDGNGPVSFLKVEGGQPLQEDVLERCDERTIEELLNWLRRG